MGTNIDGRKRTSSVRVCGEFLIAALFTTLMNFGPSPAAAPKQETFSSPGEAVEAMIRAAGSHDIKSLLSFFGPDSRDIVSSGDPVADRSGRETFVSLYQEKNRLEESADRKMVLYVGSEDWPFPIPVVKEDGSWRFNAKEGREEILARRIGRNELNSIQVCLAYVDAQREYALKDRDNDGLLEYAQKFNSDRGKKNGLYWKAERDGEQSPLGLLVAAAQKEGYGEPSSGNSSPYHGYYYRILNGQGKHAKGGEYGYVANGSMIGGFALVAYPAQYGSSGIMSFIVNHDGMVYQQDMGRGTEKAALAMKVFDPDSSWKKVEQPSAER